LVQRFLPIVLTLVIGILLGSWQPRGEVLALRAELDELRVARPCKATAASSVRRLLDAGAQTAGKKPETSEKPSQELPVSTPEPAAPDPPLSAPPSEADFEADKEAAKAALDARRAQALAALAEQSDLSDEELKSVEEAIDSFNSNLKASVDAFVAEAKTHGTVERRDVMALGADILDHAVTADDSLHSLISAESRQGMDPELLDPFSYISGDVVESVSELKDMEFPDF
jgi:DNA-binding transcriptional ArsR family regulator